MLGIKPILLMLLVGFLIWLFMWPLVECWYALSFDPLLTNSWKLFSFFIGCIVLLVGIIHGKKLLV